MKLYRGILVLSMMAGAAALAGCSRSGDDNPAPADNAAASTPASDTDTTDETAPSAPPAPQAESPGAAPAPSYVYVQGSWRYSGGRYVWSRGHWEPPHAGAQLYQPRWVEVGGKWEHHPARWGSGGHVDAPARPGEQRPGEQHPGEQHPGEGHPGEQHPGEHR
jgi:hypothetical protein